MGEKNLKRFNPEAENERFHGFYSPFSTNSRIKILELQEGKRVGVFAIQLMKQKKNYRALGKFKRPTSISNIICLKILAFAPDIEPLSDHFLGPRELQTKRANEKNNQIPIFCIKKETRERRKKNWNSIQMGF